MTAPRARGGCPAGTGIPLLAKRLAYSSLPSELVATRASKPTHAGSAVPPLHRRHLRRPRLTRLLDASAAQSILITAPAGYGKTSLACEWLADRRDVAWYRATAASADLAAFSIGIADCMQHVVPGAGKRLRQRLMVGEPPERAARPMAELLAEDLEAWPDGARLVLDDYHLVADSAPVEEFVDWLLTLAARLRVVVTSRRRPRWASARRLLHGEIVEMGHQQLAMSDGEAAKLLDGRPGDSVRQLVAQAQGWPALIGLASLAMEAAIPDEHVTEQLYRYFAEEVYRTQEDDLRRFMLVASVPSSLSATVARSVLDESDPGSLLERLLDAGLVQPVGEGELAFHPLLRDFLRRKLEGDDPETFAALADGVVEFARTHGRWEESLELSIHRRQFEKAAEIVAEASRELLPAGQIETLDNWLTACGTAANRPPALLVKVDVLLRQGRVREAYALAQDMVRRVDDASDYASRAWYLAGQAANLACEQERHLTCQMKALETATTPAETGLALWGATLAALELELEDADGFLERLETLAPDDINNRLRVVNGQAWAARHRNEQHMMWVEIENAIPLVDYANDPNAVTSFLLLASYLAMLRADYGRSITLWARGDALCDRYRLGFAKELLQAPRAYALVGARKMRSAAESIVNLRQTAAEWSDAYLWASAEIVEARLNLARGELHAALEILLESTTPPSQRAMLAERLATTAIVEASLCRHDEAKTHARSAIRLSRCSETAYLARFAESISRLRAVGNTESREGVVQLFLDAEAHALLDAVVVAYRAYPPLLGILAGDARTSRAVAVLCTRASDTRLAKEAGIELNLGRSPQPTVDRLTKREREVLDLISDGLTNGEIARRLYIAESTAKVHVHRILKKLGVRSRLQALLVARETLEH
jgi:LuxR family maltose regulon positive regulatory protein